MAAATAIAHSAVRAPISATKRLLRTKEAAEYMAMSKDTILEMADTGELPFIQRKPHGPWLFDIRDLDAWIDTHKE